MGYRNLQQCVSDLESAGHLIRFDHPVDPKLQLAEIQRRIYASGGPAVLFTNVKDCRFPMLGNLFGSMERAEFLFRDTIDSVQKAIQLKGDPEAAMKNPWAFRKMPLVGWRMRPKKVSSGPVLKNKISLRDLPGFISWPKDGGPFVTLPQVYSQHPDASGFSGGNLGMYRVQLAGNDYHPENEVGLHYQIHRGIGVHHQRAMELGKPLKVNVFVGGNPAMTLAAVMPLPEGMSELGFAGALAGHRIPMAVSNSNVKGGGLPIYAEADFCISGTVHLDETKPEGPFGDHLGYYSLAHPFPVLKVDAVYHRDGAIWPFTVVGRPPQEDTTFGNLIHQLTGTIIPTVLPGIDSVHAVDAAGVHPLLLAIGTERYTPYQKDTRPKEILTQANAILGQGQMSLAKYVAIMPRGDVPELDIHNEEEFFTRLLERIDFRRDLHFQTQTTIDTLDYSGDGLNQGSKVVLAAAGEKRRELPTEFPTGFSLPDGWSSPQIVSPGILAVQQSDSDVESVIGEIQKDHPANRFPLIVVCDDSQFCAKNFQNFLWVTFTRSNPAADIYGIESTTVQKHWGCQGSLVIDARVKSHHAPPLIEDAEVTKSVDAMAAGNLSISKWL